MNNRVVSNGISHKTSKIKPPVDTT